MTLADAGITGKIYSSSDSGFTWVTHTLPFGIRAMRSTLQGLVAIATNMDGTDCSIVRTTDLSTNWVKVYNLTGVEKAINGGFNSDTSGWSPENCTLASAPGITDGTNCCQLTMTGGTYQLATQPVSIKEGHTYRLSGYVKSGTSGADEFRVFVWISTGGWRATLSGTTTSSWTYYSSTFTASAYDAAATSTLLMISKWSTKAGTMLFDHISLVDLSEESQNFSIISPDIRHKTGVLVYSDDGINTEFSDYMRYLISIDDGVTWTLATTNIPLS